jgi:hypothetical protein
MKNKTTAARKGTAPKQDATAARDIKAQPLTLAEMIAAMMSHPDLPPVLQNYFGEGICELFNHLNSEQQTRLEHEPTRLAQLLDMLNENTKGGAR